LGKTLAGQLAAVDLKAAVSPDGRWGVQIGRVISPAVAHGKALAGNHSQIQAMQSDHLLFWQTVTESGCKVELSISEANRGLHDQCSVP
jgi:hypothetical protein